LVQGKEYWTTLG